MKSFQTFVEGENICICESLSQEGRARQVSWVSRDTDADLNEVGKQRRAEFLLENITVPVDTIAAGDQSWKQNVDKRRVTEVWKRQGTELLKNCRRLTRLHYHLRTHVHTVPVVYSPNHIMSPINSCRHSCVSAR